jgi:predicted nucleic acid-binding protein
LIYVDASVTLAEVFAEDRRPQDGFWDLPLVASRLTDLEMRARAAALGRLQEKAAVLDEISNAITFADVERKNLEFLYAGQTGALRTLDAIHLATLEFFNRELGETVLATYDHRLATAAHALGFAVMVP